MKLAIITGGSKGLGKALCEKYLSQGWNVVEFSRSGTSDSSVKADLSDPKAAAKIFSETFATLKAEASSQQESFDEIIAIHNVGTVNPIAQVNDLSADGVEHNFNINLSSGVMFAQCAVDAFQDTPCKKSFVGISSGAALRGFSGWSLYCAAKAGMENFVRSLAVEQEDREHPICAVNINPSIMDTGMQVDIRSSSVEAFPTVDQFKAYKTEGQLQTAEEVAQRVFDIVESNPEGGSTLNVR